MDADVACQRWQSVEFSASCGRSKWIQRLLFGLRRPLLQVCNTCTQWYLCNNCIIMCTDIIHYTFYVGRYNSGRRRTDSHSTYTTTKHVPKSWKSYRRARCMTTMTLENFHCGLDGSTVATRNIAVTVARCEWWGIPWSHWSRPGDVDLLLLRH